jgi:methionine-rich copper-binding protein CopC
MKIKKLLTRSSILMAVAIVSTVGIASAALINALTTGKVSTNAEIAAPVSMNVNEGRDGTVNSQSSINIETYGGSDFQFTTVAKNNANNKIEGFRVLVAESPADKNFTGKEVEKVFMESAYNVNTDITGQIYVVYPDGSLNKLSDWTGNSRRLVLTTSSDGTNATKASLNAGEADWNTFTITTNPAIAPGSYAVYSDFVTNLAQYAAEQYAL